jgi:hypothetical protein
MAMLGTLTAGCAVAGAPSIQPAARRQAPWPPGGSPAVARAVGMRMLARLVLPPGSRRVSASREPPRAEVIGSDSLIDLHRFFSIPLPMLDAATFVNRHTPVGSRPNGPELGTTSSQSGAVYFDFVSFYLRKAPVGVTGDTMLLVTFAEGPHGSTLARADAEVVWYPPRTAAEYLRPGAIRSARITATLLNPKPRHIVRVIRSRHAIGTLTALLNGMHAAGRDDWSCPAFRVDYRLSLIGRGGQSRVVVDPTG